MPTLSFITPGQIDSRAFSAFGLSSKDSSQIGRFGTGLKYAISIILRAGGRFEIVSPNETLRFSVKAEDFRGTSAQFVYVNDERLPFTTDLGKDWEMWMAYRELFSNTLDEGGRVDFWARVPDEPAAGETSINIQCNELLAIYFNHDLYFIDLESEKPISESDDLEVYSGQTNSIFYKGISIYKNEKPFKYRYNLKNFVKLSEDRTASSSFLLINDLATSLAAMEDEKLLRSVLNKDSDCMEASLVYRDYMRPSAAFIGVVETLGDACLSSARILAAKHKLQNADKQTMATRNRDAAKEKAISYALAKLKLAGGNTSVITPAIADEGEIKGSYELRSDGLLIIAEEAFSSQSLVDKVIFAAYCDMQGRNWLINSMITRLDGEFEG